MIALIQRVARASVTIDDKAVGAIHAGVLALVAAERDDTQARAERLAERVLAYRIFADAQGRMNIAAQDLNVGILAVPQFTLAADTRRGNRPGFSSALSPDRATVLFDVFVAALASRHQPVETGRFGANMQITSVNDGPVTFWLQA